MMLSEIKDAYITVTTKDGKLIIIVEAYGVPQDEGSVHNLLWLFGDQRVKVTFEIDEE